MVCQLKEKIEKKEVEMIELLNLKDQQDKEVSLILGLFEIYYLL